MRITCPHCGTRGNEEFSYLGDATVVRPTDAGPDARPAWVDYVYNRDNPAGPHREYWYHAAGCHAWLIVERDTVTHEILSVVTAKSVALQRIAERGEPA